MVGSKDFEMPNTCGDCPYCIHTADEKRYIGYCNTSDDDYYCKALDRFMEYDKVDGGVDILGKPLDCPLVETIPKDQYKADMVAMLEVIKLRIDSIPEPLNRYRVNYCIQEKINALKADRSKEQIGENT